jgi:hypothetical protein
MSKDEYIKINGKPYKLTQFASWNNGGYSGFHVDVEYTKQEVEYVDVNIIEGVFVVLDQKALPEAAEWVVIV